MILRSQLITEARLAHIINHISAERYESNLNFSIKQSYETRKGWYVTQFRLSVKDCKGPGHKLGFTITKSGRRRRLSAACWHVFRDVIQGIYDTDTDAKVKTSIANYTNKENFMGWYEDTGNINIGSMMEPLYFKDACECGLGLEVRKGYTTILLQSKRKLLIDEGGEL